jgi:hypothetical protein
MKHARLVIPPVGFELKAFDMNRYIVEGNTKRVSLGSIAHKQGGCLNAIAKR